MSSTLVAQTNLSNIKKDIVYLSSDKLRGRFPGTKGEEKAANYIAKEFKRLKLEPIGTDNYFQKFTYIYNKNPHATDGGHTIEGTAKNVIAYLDNLAPYTIIIGAHYDHLGFGLAGNSLDANPENKIHNGADDNASGTSGVLELARYYATNKTQEPFNFLFICFSAEEEGLLGSKYFTNNPTLNLEKITCMINMDMIGRLNDSSRITLSGIGTSPAWGNVLNLLDNNRNIKIGVKKDSSGMGPSDHASFYLKNIPVLHFFTGTHSDYHKPSDDAEKINYTGTQEVLNYIIQLIDKIPASSKLVFTPTKTEMSTKSASFKVTLGVMPDYAFDGTGLRIDGVTEGKPAQKAGLEQGDIIIAMGDLEIKNIQDYMKGLSLYKKGDSVILKVKRGEKILELAATF